MSTKLVQVILISKGAAGACPLALYSGHAIVTQFAKLPRGTLTFHYGSSMVEARVLETDASTGRVLYECLAVQKTVKEQA